MKDVFAAAGGADVIPLSFLTGSKIPVGYDPEDRSKTMIDEPALHERAQQHWHEGKQAQRNRAEAVLTGGDPYDDGGDSAAEEELMRQVEVQTHSGGGGGPDDTAAKLERLADLHRRGDLTDDEFAAAKQSVLRS